MTGMHMHVALDHKDVHMEDRQTHVHQTTANLHDEIHPDHDIQGDDHAVGHGQSHIEVNLDSQALSKKPSSDSGVDELLFVAVLILLVLAPRRLTLLPIRLITPLLRQLLYLRPPLRGPPLHA